VAKRDGNRNDVAGHGVGKVEPVGLNVRVDSRNQHGILERDSLNKKDHLLRR
jgi:hypothetical protein